MKNPFSGLNAQNISQAFQNPLTMAGFAVMQGVPMGQALMGAAEANRQNQVAQAQMAEHQAKLDQVMRARLFAQQLPDTLKGLGATNIEDATAKLIAIGADPEQALKLAQGVRPDVSDQVIPDALGGYHVVRKENGQVIGGAGQGTVGGMSRPNADIYTNSIAGIKKQGEADIDEQKEVNKEFRKYKDEVNLKADEASENLQTIRQMKDLATQFYQGPGANVVQGAGAVSRAFGGPSFGATAAETFKAQSNKLILDISKDQVGNQSNTDMQRITETSPELTKTPEGNQNLLNALEALNMRKEQKAAALNAYLEQGGKPEKFKEIWRKYVNSFPLIMKDQQGFLQINAKNLDNWNLILSPDFDKAAVDLRGASKFNPAQAAPSKFKAKNGHIYTKEEIEAALRGE